MDLSAEMHVWKHHKVKTKPIQDKIKGPTGLTEDEAAAIYFFTCESSLYRKLNKKLRSSDRAGLQVRNLKHIIHTMAPRTEPYLISHAIVWQCA